MKIPDLPSDEELGIAGLDEEELLGGKAPGDAAAARRPGARAPSTPPASPPPPGRPPRPAPAVPGPGPARGGGWLLALLTLLVLGAGLWGGSSNRTLPRPVAANAPDSAFSSSRALAQLVEIARAPRPVGAPEHTRVRELIVERLRELGLEPEVETSTWIDRRAQNVRAVTLRNIVARIPGAESTGAIVLTAHYDGVPLSPAAGDDGVGVVTVLETVRALLAGPRLRNDVIVLLTDGEELGLLGARAFVQQHPWLDDVRMVISAEMRGAGGPAVMFETGRDNGWLVRALQRGDPAPAAWSLSLEVYRRLPNDTDFSPFRDAGFQGINSAAIGRAWAYHQATDTPANVQESTLQQHGVRMLAMTRLLGRLSLADVHAPDRVYTTLPLAGMVSYDRALVPAFALALFGLWILAVLLVVARGAGGMSVGVGALLAFVAAAITAAAGATLMLWLPAFHAEYGFMVPAFYEEGWYLAALVAIAVAAVTGVFNLAWPRFAWAGMAVGALVLPVGIGVAVSVVAPLASFSFQAVAFAGVLAAILVAAGTPRRRHAARGGSAGEDVGGGGGRGAGAGGRAGGGGVRGAGTGVTPELRRQWRAERIHPLAWLGALLLGVVTLVSIVPVIELLWIAMSFRLAALLGVLITVTLLCLLPALGAAAAPNRGWTAAAGIAAAVVLVGVGVLRARSAPSRPAPSTLVYAFDRESGQAIWASRPDAGFPWAQERVGPLSETRVLDEFLWTGTQFRTGPAPVTDAPLPTAWVEAGLGDGRVRIGIAAGSGAEIVSVRVPEGGGSIVAVNGRVLPITVEGPGGGRPITRVSHQGVPDGALLLDLELPAGTPFIMLDIVEEHLRPHELVGAEPFRRPPALMPAAWMRSDRALLRTPVRISLDGG